MGGFYVSNTKTTDLKQGDKFNKGDIIAKNPQYFHGGPANTEYVVGNLTKICIHSGYYTFEDASICTEQFCREMTSLITMKKEVILGPNTNVDFMVKIGDKIKTSEPLIIFEESFDEKEANELLSKIADELQEKIVTLSKNYVKSKYTGVIEDIKIYYTVPEEDLSPSLRKIVTEYNKNIQEKRDTIKKYYGDKESNLILPPNERVEPVNGKVKGVEVGDGVLIEFYIKYEDELGIGKLLPLNIAIY